MGGDCWAMRVGQWLVEDDWWELTDGRWEVTGGRKGEATNRLGLSPTLHLSLEETAIINSRPEKGQRTRMSQLMIINKDQDFHSKRLANTYLHELLTNGK